MRVAAHRSGHPLHDVIDLHSHVVPALDDGPDDLEASVLLRTVPYALSRRGL